MRQLIAASVLVLALTGACRAKDPASNVGALVEDLKGPDREKSGRANLALIRVGEPAVPALLELVGTGDPRLRHLALSTLWGMGERAKTAVPFLADVLSDPDPEIRNGAAMALENMGPAAEAAVPALIKALGDADNRVRQTAVKALGNIGPAARPAIPTMTLALRRGRWPEAEEALRKIKGQVEELPAPEPR
jgi:hypothetical protein